MDLLVKELVAVEEKNYDVFDEYIAKTIVEGYAKAISHRLSTLVKIGETPEIELPHGTYRAAEKSNNINVAFDVTKDFVSVINGEKEYLQKWETFDEKFVETLINFIDCGEATLDDPNIDQKRVGIELSRNEAIYFIRSISTCLAGLAKQFEKPGKEFDIDIMYHGRFVFTYGDKTSVRFVADEVFKQAVKADEALTTEAAVAFTTSRRKAVKRKHESFKLTRV